MSIPKNALGTLIDVLDETRVERDAAREGHQAAVRRINFLDRELRLARQGAAGGDDLRIAKEYAKLLKQTLNERERRIHELEAQAAPGGEARPDPVETIERDLQALRSIKHDVEDVLGCGPEELLTRAARRVRDERDNLQGRLDACRQRAEDAEAERNTLRNELERAREDLARLRLTRTVSSSANPEPTPERIPEYAWAKAVDRGFPGEWHTKESVAWCEEAARSHPPAYVTAVLDRTGRCFRLFDNGWSSQWHGTTDACRSDWLAWKEQRDGKHLQRGMDEAMAYAESLSPAESVETGEAS